MSEKKTFSEFQSNLKPPIKNKIVDFTAGGRRIKYAYATLSDLIECVRKPLGEAGISWTQTMGIQVNAMDSVFGLTTTLLKESQVIATSFVPLPDPVKMKPQDFASHLTYFRRYSLACILGIESEEDDDGQVAQDIHKEPSVSLEKRYAPTHDNDEPLPNFAPQAELTTLDRIKNLASTKKISPADLKEMSKRLTGKSASKDMNEEELNTILNWLKAK